MTDKIHKIGFGQSLLSQNFKLKDVKILRGASAAWSGDVVRVSIICRHGKYSHRVPVYSPGNAWTAAALQGWPSGKSKDAKDSKGRWKNSVAKEVSMSGSQTWKEKRKGDLKGKLGIDISFVSTASTRFYSRFEWRHADRMFGNRTGCFAYTTTLDIHNTCVGTIQVDLLWQS